MSSLKDFYNDPEVQDEEDSEDDEDFVPDENESDDQDVIEDDDDDEEEQVKPSSKTKGKKRALDEPSEEEESTKKSRIDAIWADMNTTKTPPPKDEPASDPEPSTTAAPAAPEKKQIKKPKSPLQQKRPKSQLSSLVSKYNIKEPKMNTLEKSKLDWQGYVDREGIRDDLKYKNKDGYMEKVAFLQRVDDRRLNQLKQGQKKEKK
ncbi:bucentaur or craniofacial development-domain-containing protein [Mucor lusitanicus]|uniref:SWR1-complex protein 5 n=1 Tax=Mucor lusitanicus CBS 277.49 TaxID=747725 RepID=A0A162TCC4_MUCCL|nr:hypothetical protein MUCCIDRAFT_110391 [Mucor lusitanicus CBS 277.49]